jgi:fused signal recognition particle receptor
MFNWFRRQFNEKETKQEESPSTVGQVTTETNSTEEEPEAKVAPNPQQDYLTWAKAAYQNIQKRQEQVTEVSNNTEKEISVETASETTPVTETNQPQTSTSETPIAEDNSPAWLKQGDRLSKLKETALETPFKDNKANKNEPAVVFDDDFVWSAQVLAAQGRTPEDISEEEINWLKRLRQGLGKTRRGLINQLRAVVGQGPLNEEAVMTIESLLLQADVGIEATDYIISTLQTKLLEEALPSEEAIAYLKQILQKILDQPLKGEDNAAFVPEKDTFNIWLLTGVNGAGKTTTIGKLANLAQKSGYSCLIAAADTFRAAAVEQVKVWGERTNTPVVANPGKNTDPAAVVYDAIAAAQARQTDLLLVDTAGRLQNKKNLMAELSKIRRIIEQKAPQARIESLLVLDATLGQNGLRQAQVFAEAAKLSGIVLTKLDGTAKGGVALAVAQQLDLPIRFIGAGEGIEDLRPFSSYEFVEALLNG